MSSGVQVYFGGTFDPPHLGHHEMLAALLQDAWVDCVHVVPTGLNPLKPGNSTVLGTNKDRLDWVETWLKSDFSAELANKRLRLETIEIEGEGPHYTVDTLNALRAKGSLKAPWVLCVGGDIPRDFHLWKDVEKLFGSLHSVWVFPRGAQNEPLAEMHIGLRKLCEFRVMGRSVREVSSTEIRELLRGADALQKIGEAPLPLSVQERLRVR